MPSVTGYPTAVAVDNTVGTGIAWAYTSKLLTEDADGAQCLAAFGNSERLLAKDWDWSGVIPTGATIDGLAIRWVRKGDGTVTHDYEIMISVDGSTVSGDNKSSGATWSSSYADGNFGGASDDWGVALTPAILQSSDFFASLRLEAFGFGGDAFVDYVDGEVFFTPPDAIGASLGGLRRRLLPSVVR